MNNERKQLVYISGPPCAGKSSICKELVKTNKTKYILGDDAWIYNEKYDFDLRIKRTNQGILECVKGCTSNLILLEWVPSTGSFIDSLKELCRSKEYEFIHIIIYAPKDILLERKLKRDGNTDLGPVNLDGYKYIEGVTLFDSSNESINSIAEKCENIIKRKKLKY